MRYGFALVVLILATLPVPRAGAQEPADFQGPDAGAPATALVERGSLLRFEREVAMDEKLGVAWIGECLVLFADERAGLLEKGSACRVAFIWTIERWAIFLLESSPALYLICRRSPDGLGAPDRIRVVTEGIFRVVEFSGR